LWLGDEPYMQETRQSRLSPKHFVVDVGTARFAV
jgi:hypothetical protein